MITFDPQFLITDEIFQKCSDFASASVGTSTDKYARRNQFNAGKIVKDIRNGKLGEEGVYSKLITQFPKMTAPDHKIYSKKDKSWDPDLKDGESNLRFAVKSQDVDSSIAYGESWVFQFGRGGNFDCDTGVFKKIDPDHYVAFVALNTPKRTGAIRAIVRIQWLHEKELFKPMKLKHLQNNKLAVYYEDLEKLKDELWQI